MRRNGGFTRRDLMRAAAALGGAAVFPARGAEPVRLGFTMSLTGGTAPNGKQLLASIELWRDDVNARGGLLGRPVQLVYYDDQSNPATVPGLYTKLLDVDKVDLVIGPYSTNMVAPAMPVLMQREMTTVSILALAANSRFHYPRYFSMIPAGPNPKTAFSSGFFTLAAAQNPRPKTVAIIAADAEFARNSADGARENAQSSGFSVVYDRTYPPSTVEFGSLMRAVQAASADLVYVASYPPDTVGIVRAANEVRLEPKMFGGTLIGLLATPFKMQLGPLANGIVNSVSFIPAPKFDFPGNRDLLRRYQARAQNAGVDPLGYSFVPFGYGAAQVLEQAVEATRGFDSGRIADYIRTHSFSTVLGNITFGADGEWSRERMVFTQFQNVTGNDLDQFRDAPKELIVAPEEYRSGELIYPYARARR